VSKIHKISEFRGGSTDFQRILIENFNKSSEVSGQQ